MGSELISVTDNGAGISPDNYSAVGLKHCTSKIGEFDDLNSLNSFGFRGEALNALCELSGNVNISTKQNLEEIGSQLLFNRRGVLVNTLPAVRSVGTTVNIEQLFLNLPVRRQEFLR
jgi:DNA mismatch repair protein PMS2